MTRVLALLAVAFILLGTRCLRADDDSGINRELPRGFGWFIGDVLIEGATVDVEQRFQLDPASLPRPGPVTYWLDLRSVTIDQDEIGGTLRRYRVSLEYQTFYSPLEPKRMTVPGITLGFVAGEERIERNFGDWTFVTSPLREIMAPTHAAALRPDAALSVINTKPAQIRAAVFGGLAVLALVALAWHRAWWPFRRRAARPFTQAVLRIKELAQRGHFPAYCDALRTLHRALDQTNGRRVLADDLGDVLAAHPMLAPAAGDLPAFFAASRSVFFDRAKADIPAGFGFAELGALARRLAAAERIRP